jgi:hypothetical protein
VAQVGRGLGELRRRSGRPGLGRPVGRGRPLGVGRPGAPLLVAVLVEPGRPVRDLRRRRAGRLVVRGEVPGRRVQLRRGAAGADPPGVGRRRRQLPVVARVRRPPRLEGRVVAFFFRPTGARTRTRRSRDRHVLVRHGCFLLGSMLGMRGCCMGYGIGYGYGVRYVTRYDPVIRPVTNGLVTRYVRAVAAGVAEPLLPLGVGAVEEGAVLGVVMHRVAGRGAPRGRGAVPAALVEQLGDDGAGRGGEPAERAGLVLAERAGGVARVLGVAEGDRVDPDAEGPVREGQDLAVLVQLIVQPAPGHRPLPGHGRGLVGRQ